MVIESIGRRLRLAVIGGGPASEIGEVHRIAARLDGYYDIVASALSSDPERSRRSGRAIGVSEDRAYPSWRALIESEAGRADRSDIGAVMTPNDSHYEICAAALDGGFHIICDKPLTTDLGPFGNDWRDPASSSPIRSGLSGLRRSSASERWESLEVPDI